ncbi:hypothetical protein AB1K54_09385 [Microbacterium sp. BWT-B31]|uniref:hypothetical protein n=1 Tax=Microbacterium sp. BWT-B31 TaxID=3232072 RepID=UPI003527BCEB
MSDDLEILSGGAIAVDTDTLRRAASGFTAALTDLDELAMRLDHSRALLLEHRDDAAAAEAAAFVLFSRLGDVMHEATDLAESLQSAAMVYELVELNVEYDAASTAGDAAAMSRIDARRAAIMAADPDAFARAKALELNRAGLWQGELVHQATVLGIDVGGFFDDVVRDPLANGVAGLFRKLAGDVAGEAAGEVAKAIIGGPPAVIGGLVFGLGAMAGTAATGLSRSGLIARDARLAGGPAEVTITRVPPAPAPTPAPTSLASAAERVPSGTSARVRVEKYTMPDGSREFAVYVAGTQTGDGPAGEAWDFSANGSLYTGHESASYTATEKALADAGAQPGDTVHAFGFSQGAMITAHLATGSDYDVQTLVSYGSPVEADVGPGTLSVGIRHRDDPVAALAGGGHFTPVGAEGSFVAERTYDPATGIHDMQMPAHSLDAYTRTAAVVDASGDARLAGVNDVFERLGDAASVTVTEYSAAKVSSTSSGAG